LAHAWKPEVLLEEGVPGHMRDLGMPQTDEVGGGGLGDAGVVNPDGGSAGQRAADAHNRPVDGQQLLYLSFTELERHGDDGIHAFSQQEVVQDAVPAVRPFADVVQGQVIPGIQQSGRDPFHHRREVPTVDGRDHHTHVVVPA